MYVRYFPNNVFDYQFLDENIASFYAQENKLAVLTKLFSLIAIFISCLGLYGLISFMAAQRIKEIGVRKVLGASVLSIVILFCKEFLLLLVIAFLMSSPVGWYFMKNWLSGFAYHIEIHPSIFLFSILGILIIATVTVSFECIKAAMANPVKSLRSE